MHTDDQDLPAIKCIHKYCCDALYNSHFVSLLQQKLNFRKKTFGMFSNIPVTNKMLKIDDLRCLKVSNFKTLPGLLDLVVVVVDKIAALNFWSFSSSFVYKLHEKAFYSGLKWGIRNAVGVL